MPGRGLFAGWRLGNARCGRRIGTLSARRMVRSLNGARGTVPFRQIGPWFARAAVWTPLIALIALVALVAWVPVWLAGSGSALQRPQAGAFVRRSLKAPELLAQRLNLAF